MSVFYVILLVGFLVYSAIIGQSQPLFSSKAIAEGKGLITVYADGQKKTFATNASNIGDALKQNNIDLGQGDVTEPSLDTPIDQPHLNVNTSVETTKATREVSRSISADR